jgi:tetratricopeptide (TPR) repeat protein
MLDAEWILHNGKDLLQYCQEHQKNAEPLYLIKVQDVEIEFVHARLIRCKSNVKFTGKVHEIPNIKPNPKLPDHIYFKLNTTQHGKEKSKQRWLKDIDILLQELKEKPNDSRIIYFLGQTYFWLNDIPNAIYWYEFHISTFKDREENFEFLLALAKAYHADGNIEKMINSYLEAFAVRPDRAEPLIKIAEYYYQIGYFHLCFLFAKHAITIPYPNNDFGLINKYLYEFFRYDLISATAYIVGDFKLGEQATLKALQARPDKEYLHKNLTYYQTKLSEKGMV